MRSLGVVAAFICATVASPATAQDTADALPLSQNAPKPIYTPEAMLRRIAPPQEQNAALGYWMAFAQMKEPPAGSFSPDLLDANAAALATLARASRLPFCDWGIDYALGPNAPMAHLPKARVLARLNAASAVRALSRGSGDQAVEDWLVGMRFAMHIQSGGTLISTLTAWSALSSTWQAIEMAVDERRLTATQRARLAEAIRLLPETIFDWDRAVLNEARVLPIAAALAKPGRGSFVPPTAEETTRFLREVERVGDAFKRSPDQTAVAIAAYEAALLEGSMGRETGVHRFYRESMPSLTKTNQTRREVKAARDRLLAALK
jgi:hypothetical protein